MANDKPTKQRRAKEEGKRMASVAQRSDTTVYEDAHAEGERRYTWLEDYLDRLAGKDDYRAFQERHYGTPERHTIAAWFAA
jgi:hypothetical protein